LQTTRKFIVAATVPRSDHLSGTLEAADAILAGTLETADAILAADPADDIYVSAVRGDVDGVRRLVADNPTCATAPDGPYDWDALTYLCFSRYLRDRGSNDFVRAAEALLDAGPDSNTGFFEPEHQPEPTFESALYGAAGVAHHGGLTRLLLARGADPNALSAWGHRALDHALGRDNRLALLETLLDFGADPSLRATSPGARSAIALAARVGRADALELFRRRGFAVELEGDDAFFAAVSCADREAALGVVAAEPGIVERLEASEPGTVATELSLAERALTEPSDFAPHQSSEILDMLRAAGSEARR
jgi:hypothetical protein